MTAKTGLRAAVLAMALALDGPASAQVAQVLEVRGIAMVERAGSPPRLIGAGEDLSTRDAIRTAAQSWAVLRFDDGARVTLRPATVFRIESWREGGAARAVLGLEKGGVHAVTGLLGRRHRDGMAIRTPVSRIGLRGAEVVARLCDGECESEARDAPQVAGTVAGRVGAMAGGVSALRPDGRWRGIALGEPVHVNDAIVTGNTGAAVLFFPDGTRLALEPGSILIVDQYRWNGAGGEATFLLVDGVSDITTGGIAQRNPDRLRFFTPDGAVRFLGTRARIATEPTLQTGPAPASVSTADTGGGKGTGQTTVSVYSGAVMLQGGGEGVLVQSGQRGMADGAGIASAGSAAPDTGLRSNGFSAGPALFGSAANGAAGLYLAVVEGKATAGDGGNAVVVGAGEAMRFGGGGGAGQRLNGMSGFLLADLFVAPTGSGAVSCTPVAVDPGPGGGGSAARDLRFDTANLRIGLDKAAFPANLGLAKSDPVLGNGNGRGLGPTDSLGGAGQTLGTTGEIRPAVSLSTRVRGGFMGGSLDQGAITSSKWSQSGGGNGFQGPTSGQVASGVGDDVAGLISEMLTAEGGTPTGDPKADAAELAYAQSVGPDWYAATKDMGPQQRRDFWGAVKHIQGSRGGRPRDDVDTGGGGPPVVMRRSDGGLNAAVIRRQIADALGQAGGAGDGRTDQQASAGGGAMAMQLGQKLGVPQGEGGTGTLNMNAVMRLDPLVNFQ